MVTHLQADVAQEAQGEDAVPLPPLVCGVWRGQPDQAGDPVPISARSSIQKLSNCGEVHCLYQCVRMRACVRTCICVPARISLHPLVPSYLF